jgi:hypothetical protein
MATLFIYIYLVYVSTLCSLVKTYLQFFVEDRYEYHYIIQSWPIEYNTTNA